MAVLLNRRYSKLRASNHAGSDQVLRHKIRRRAFPDGLKGDQDDHFLQRCPARGPHGAGNVIPNVLTVAEPILTRIRGRKGDRNSREKRSGNLRIHEPCLPRPCGDHGQHGQSIRLPSAWAR